MSAGPTPASRKPSGLPGWVVPVAVLGAIAAILVLPARDQLRPAPEPELKPLELAALPPPPSIPAGATAPKEASPDVRVYGGAISPRGTDRPNGTTDAELSPDGAWAWWFDDTDGDEFGVWRRQPFAGGPDEEAVPGVPAAYSAGLALGRDGTVVVGTSTDDEGTALYLRRAGSTEVEVVYRHAEYGGIGDLSYDSSLLAVDHTEHGDAMHSAIRVLRLSDGARDGRCAPGHRRPPGPRVPRSTASRTRRPPAQLSSEARRNQAFFSNSVSTCVRRSTVSTSPCASATPRDSRRPSR